MNSSSYYSKKLNLVLEIIRPGIDLDGLIELKSLQIKNGNVDEKTKVLAFSEIEVPLVVSELKLLGERLEKEVPQYARAPTAVISRQIGPTASTMKLARDVQQKQRMAAFSTINAALAFLVVHFEDLIEEFPNAVSTIMKYKD